MARLLEAKFLKHTEKIQLKVLVWGPAPTATSDFSAKRRQIKDALISDWHAAYFSEDLVPRGGLGPADLFEFQQAQEVDCIIILSVSFGSSGEAHQYGLTFGRKILLWLPPKAKGGFTDQGVRRSIEAAGGRSVYFKDADLVACSISLASVDFVNERRYRRALLDAQIEELQKERERL